jgi:hypothetical protein
MSLRTALSGVTSLLSTGVAFFRVVSTIEIQLELTLSLTASYANTTGLRVKATYNYH